MENTESFTPQLTEDGSFTFFSANFGEMFHSHYGAKQEAELKFVESTDLKHKALNPSLKLLDICYGLGYNTAAALEAIWQVNPDCCVELIGLELDPNVAQSAIAHRLLDSWSSPIREVLTDLAIAHQVQTDRIQARLLIGDARVSIQHVFRSGFEVDAIFLDPFSPPTCPQLWTVEFLGLVAKCLKPDGKLATYSCSAAVRTALKEVMLEIGATPPVGRRSPGTVASYTNGLPPLSLQEQEHLLTTAAIPYRDPFLCDTSASIVQRRQLEQHNSALEPTSRWKHRWTPTENNYQPEAPQFKWKTRKKTGKTRKPYP